VFSDFLQGSVVGSTYLFIILRCNSIKHSKYFCLPTLQVSRSISSATDTTLPQSDIDSVRGRRAADFMNLDTEESKVQCCLRIVLKRWDS
jgi:hypothetical protein